MENCFADTSVNSILLLKERIIKVETLLKKYACLARKFKDLEKSHNDVAENEKNAKKDAAKYLEKYCKLTKKCSALLTKIKSLEEIVKDKTDLVTEHQNELAKLDSVLKIYKTERQNYQKLEKDKNFLLSFVWRLFKDSGFESKVIKNRKAAETIFKRFERDLEDLKLGDFTNRKLKKTSKSIVEHLETPSSVELPILCNSDDFGFIDVDAAIESINCLSNQKLDGLEEVVQEFKEKSNDSCLDRKYEKGTTSVAPEDNTCQSYISEMNVGLFESTDSEMCIELETKEFCFDVYSSVDSNPTSYVNDAYVDSGSTVKSNNSVCSPTLQKEMDKIEHSESKKNKICCNFEEKNFTCSEFLDKTKMKEVETKEASNKFSSDYDQPFNSFTSHDDPDSKSVLKNVLSFKQYGRKLNKNNPTQVNSATIKEITNSNINLSELSDEIISPAVTKRDFENLSNNLYDGNWSNTTQMKRTDNVGEISLLFPEENHLESGQISANVPDTEKSENQKFCRNSLFQTDSVKDKPQANTCTEETQEKHLKQITTENEGQCSSGDYKQSNCERDEGYVCNANGISNEEMTKPTNIKSDSNMLGVNLKESKSAESFQEVPDIEIFGILEQFKTVRLISPVKEIERKEKCNRGGLLLKSNRKLNPPTCSIKGKLNDEREIVQTLKNPELSSGNGSSEKATVVDASTQTDGVVLIGDNKTKEQGPEQNSKSEKPAAPRITKRLVRKIVRKLWNSKLKKKMKILNELTKIWKTHPCNIYLKSVIKYLALSSSNREKGVICNILRNGFIKSRYKSKMKAVKKKLSSWKVEDSTDTDMVSNQSQYLLGFSGKFGNFVTDDCIYNNLTKRLNEVCLPQGRGQQIKLHLDWMSKQSIDYAAQGDFFGSTIGSGFPESILLREITFKKENENFRSLPVDNYRNFKRSFSIDDCDMLDMKDISKPNIHCDSHKLLSPDQCDTDKSEFHEKSTENFSSETECTIPQRHRTVPRRSSRIQDRKNRLVDTVTPPKSGFRSSSCSTPYDSNTSDEDCKHSDSLVLTSPTVENSMPTAEQPGSWENLQEKYKVLFGETLSPESTGIISDNCRKIQPGINSSPKISYNLRRKTVNNVDESVGSSINKKARVGRVGNGRSTKSLSKTLVEDTYYSSEEEIEERNEIQMELPGKTEENGSFLDTILTAMTRQAEEFKPKTPVKRLDNETLEINSDIKSQTLSPEHYHLPFPAQQQLHMTPRSSCYSSNEGSFQMNFPDCWKFEKQNERNNAEERNSSPKKSREGNQIRNIIEVELNKFLKAEIKSVEEGEKILKPCIAALEKASENLVASVIVAEVMTNVDEELQDFDRPAPPLTQTQHRIMTVLTILTDSCKKFSKIGYTILKTIWSKLFPEKFFWPDDSVEMASRFYSALCKKLNYFKGMWRFCFKVVSSMRQRWCIPIFVVFQVWPDILHNATDIKDNILVRAFVYVILHSPKSENIRRKRQEEKILAIKHLLLNFYNYEVNVTIEQLTCELFESLSNNTPGSADALIFVAKCRQWTWNRKNIIPRLIENLTKWSNGTVRDECGFKTLEVIREISTVFPIEEGAIPSSAYNIISSLNQLLATSSSNPSMEEMVVRTLCSLGHLNGVKDILSALLDKFLSQDPLHREIRKAISSAQRKRKEFLKKSKNLKKMTAKFMQKKEEIRKKKKKMKKKPRATVSK